MMSGPSVAAAAAAADPRHMLSYVHPDNFEGLAVAAEVIALEEKKKKHTQTHTHTTHTHTHTPSPSTTPPPF